MGKYNSYGIVFLAFFSTVLLADNKQTNELPIVVITASRNNAQWYERNLDSIVSQEYSNWRLIYIDDQSTDGTADLVQNYMDNAGVSSHMTLIRNPERRGHLANQYDAIHSCNPEEMVIIVDGDDWLVNSQVFGFINNIYQTQDAWITYGQFWYWKKNKKGLCKPLPDGALQQGTVRQFSWRTSHLRTFYAGLFQKVALEDLLWNGGFLPKGADVATMFPMIEMAGTHTKFIPEVLYMYNDDNPTSFHHNPEEQRAIEKMLREKTPYKRLLQKPY